jgi:hypothetical protein
MYFMTETKNPLKDSTIINIDNESELEWWSDYFQINKDKIKEAVLIVGSSIESVRRYLQK